VGSRIPSRGHELDRERDQVANQHGGHRNSTSVFLEA
jgi:hypothetical protein